MMISAEIRWFWRASSPAELRDWFCAAEPHGFAAGGGQPSRTDEYLIDMGQRELGIKNRGRGKGVEIKSMVETAPESLNAFPFVGPVELWTKVNSSTVRLSGFPLVAVEKFRRLRKFDTTANTPIEIELVQDSTEKPTGGRALPLQGCNIEFTEITVNPLVEKWWSLGFEAFGPLSTVKDRLKAVAGVLAQRNPPPLVEGFCASYPIWLTDFLKPSAQLVGQPASGKPQAGEA